MIHGVPLPSWGLLTFALRQEDKDVQNALVTSALWGATGISRVHRKAWRGALLLLLGLCPDEGHWGWAEALEHPRETLLSNWEKAEVRPRRGLGAHVHKGRQPLGVSG